MSWTCPQCFAEVTRNPIVCDRCTSPAPDADPATVQLVLRRDLVTEAHLGALALWYRIGAVTGVAGGIFWLLVLGGVLTTVGVRSLGAPFAVLAGGVLAIWMVVTLSAAGGSFVLGHFLARRSNAARLVAASLTGLGLVGAVARFGFDLFVRPSYGYDNPFAEPSVSGWTIVFALLSIGFSIAALALLASKRAREICSSGYQDLIAKTPQVRPQLLRSPFFVLPAFGFALVAVFVVVFVGKMIYYVHFAG